MAMMLCLFLLLSLPQSSHSSTARDIEKEEAETRRLASSVRRKTRGTSRGSENTVVLDTGTPTNQITSILVRAGKKGVGGGISGAMAGVVQVLSLMWLRTIINHQCRYGTTMKQAIRILYNEGGIPRFYRGLGFAIIQAPLSRFGSAAANDGINALLGSLNATKSWGPGRSTIVAAIAVGIWRMLLMPIDTCKTVLQVDSVDGFKTLLRKVKDGKINVLYTGAIANAFSAIAAHYPWFFTYNFLHGSDFFQNFIRRTLKFELLHNALIGFIASIASDTFANSIRVVKTAKQSLSAKAAVGVTYSEVIQMIWAADGWKGLFGRGLRARILSNGLQSIIFVVVWKGSKQKFFSKKSEVEGDEDSE